MDPTADLGEMPEGWDDDPATALNSYDTGDFRETGDAEQLATAYGGESSEGDEESDADEGLSANDPWILAAQQARANARAAGFETPDEFIAAQQAYAQEQQWVAEVGDDIAEQLQAQINAGEITREQAAELYDARMIVANQNRAEEVQSLQLAQREIALNYNQAVQYNPLLGVAGNAIAPIVEALHLSGLADTRTILPILNEFANGVAERAVLAYVAQQAQNHNGPPILSAGSQVPATATGNNGGVFGQALDWADQLMRRTGA